MFLLSHLVVGFCCFKEILPQLHLDREERPSQAQPGIETPRRGEEVSKSPPFRLEVSGFKIFIFTFKPFFIRPLLKPYM